MLKRTVSGITLTLLFIGMLTLAFNIQPVKSTTTSVLYSTTIIVDGNLSDWEGIETVVIDEHEDPDGRTFSDDIDRCWLAHNSSYLFIRFDNYYSSSELEIAYFDTDRDNATGYVINNIGADYRYVFEGSFYKLLYRWEGAWVELPEADVYSVSTGEISPAFREQFEARVSLADIGNPTQVDIVFALEFGDVAPDVGHVTYTVSKVITVPDDYPTIQEAINAADTGDTIYVKAGIYYENVVVDKAVSLVGEERSNTIIDGSGSGSVLKIVADNVDVTNFTLRNCGSSWSDSGIHLEHASNCHLNQNDITNNPERVDESRIACGTGIRLDYSSYIEITKNSITNNNRGIELYNSNEIVIAENNIVKNNRTIQSAGILTTASSSISIIRNDVKDNFHGIWVGGSNNNIAENNVVSNDQEGIWLGDGSGNKILGNSITDNSYSAIHLVRCSFSEILGNVMLNNGEGLGIHLSNNNYLIGNDIKNSGWTGIILSASSYNIIEENIIQNSLREGISLLNASYNQIYHNDLINNAKQIYDFSWGLPETYPPSLNSWDDGYPSGGNYWSDYTCVDADGDGIGDTPYVIDANNSDGYPLMNPWGTGTPVASCVWTPSIPEVGELVTFDASASMPIGGEIVSYEWDFGDGNHASGMVVTHTYSSAGNYTVTLNVTDSEGLWDIEQKQIEVKPPPPPLTASISPTSASILIGQSVTFTSIVSDGYTPYTYQWYLNGAPVSGATSNTWTFTPSTSGIYYVYLKVTDAIGNTTQSETARITVAAVPVGGYSFPIKGYTTEKPLTLYLALVAILTVSFTIAKRRKKQQN